jgi:hypothetical protein
MGIVDPKRYLDRRFQPQCTVVFAFSQAGI